MGMAASQARYLALTARKTNAEWEGQQINQARTALANQSANLFNRLLGLEVPNAPKTTDYTELQYSYSDGENESVLENWRQTSSVDPNYNYIVDHYYFADIYTGAQKKLQDPQVQVGETTRYKMDRADIKVQKNNDGTYQVKLGDETYTTEPLVDKIEKDKDLKEQLTNFEVAKGLAKEDGVLNTNVVKGYQDSSGTWHFFVEKEIDDDNNVRDYSNISSYLKMGPTFVGNCKLTELDLNELTKDQATELAQILRDCPNTNINNYLEFVTSGPNTGALQPKKDDGIYTFTMNGKIYFTTEDDLAISTSRPYNPLSPIDNQERLSYYTASYVNKKIQETNQALLQTDGNGRFTSIKLDNDSVVYSLNVETVTDEAAYQDAMNEYLYKKEVYEKTIADINAKTEIIQQEDRTLELRLKQLDTEQNALSVEMDAVKKVIKDNVDKTFKTFSD